MHRAGIVRRSESLRNEITKGAETMKKEAMRKDLEKHIERTRTAKVKQTGARRSAWDELKALRALVEVAKEVEQ